MKIERVRVGAIDTICYLVASEKKNAVIIDPGAEPEKIILHIERLGLIPKIILLTHGHYDHIEAIMPIKKKYDTTIYIGEEDVALVNSEFWLHFLGRNFAEVSFDEILKDGDNLNLDELTIKAISTPGHSPGSLSFLIGNCAFTGDCLFGDGGVGRTDLWKGSFKEIKKSIEQKLFKLPDETLVYPGHGNSSTIGREKEIHKKYKILETSF